MPDIFLCTAYVTSETQENHAVHQVYLQTHQLVQRLSY